MSLFWHLAVLSIPSNDSSIRLDICEYSRRVHNNWYYTNNTAKQSITICIVDFSAVKLSCSVPMQSKHNTHAGWYIYSQIQITVRVMVLCNYLRHGMYSVCVKIITTVDGRTVDMMQFSCILYQLNYLLLIVSCCKLSNLDMTASIKHLII